MTNSEKNLIEFPCSFPVKVFGKNSDNFETFVVSIARKHIPQPNNIEVVSRLSKGDKYLSVTLTFTATSQQQLDALYQELNDSDRVVMTF